MLRLARMRFVTVAFIAAVGCTSSQPRPPANHKPAASTRATADDVLGFLPSDTAVVIGIDAVAIRSSTLYKTFEPQIVQLLGGKLDKLRAACSIDPLRSLERITLAGSNRPNGNMDGVAVVRGMDSARLVECYGNELPKHAAGMKVVKDRDVLIGTEPASPNQQTAVAAVAPTTFVLHQAPAVSHDSMQSVIASGAPLRQSPAFMKFFDRREPDAAVWFRATAGLELIDQLVGVQPSTIAGTVKITDRVSVAVSMAMATAADAERIASQLENLRGPVSAVTERFDVKATGVDVAVDVVMTEVQLRTLLGAMKVKPTGP
jgi:hypothetical protein